MRVVLERGMPERRTRRSSGRRCALSEIGAFLKLRIGWKVIPIDRWRRR
jgi:hypothetical protein